MSILNNVNIIAVTFVYSALVNINFCQALLLDSVNSTSTCGRTNVYCVSNNSFKTCIDSGAYTIYLNSVMLCPDGYICDDTTASYPCKRVAGASTSTPGNCPDNTNSGKHNTKPIGATADETHDSTKKEDTNDETHTTTTIHGTTDEKHDSKKEDTNDETHDTNDKTHDTMTITGDTADGSKDSTNMKNENDETTHNSKIKAQGGTNALVKDYAARLPSTFSKAPSTTSLKAKASPSKGTRPSGEPDCEAGGFWPAAECDEFYECIKIRSFLFGTYYTPVLHRCKKGKYFDTRSSLCVIAEESDC